MPPRFPPGKHKLLRSMLEKLKAQRPGTLTVPGVSCLHLRRDPFRQRHRGHDFDLARQGSRGYRRRNFQDAVQIFRYQLFDIHAFGQSKSPLKDAVSDLALKKLGFFHTMGDFPFATNREQLALYMDLHILWLDAWQR